MFDLCINHVFIFNLIVNGALIVNQECDVLPPLPGSLFGGNTTLATRIMAASFGQIKEFNPDVEDWDDYKERMDFFFLANGIKEANQMRAVMLSCCGPATYKLFKGLVAPKKPADHTCVELCSLMSNHKKPAPNVIDG